MSATESTGHDTQLWLLRAAKAVVVLIYVFVLIDLVLLTLGFFLKARLEERFLRAELGEGDYDTYRRRVPMLLPLGPRG